MNYHRCVSKLPLAERDIQRIQMLAGDRPVGEPAVEGQDAVVADTIAAQ